MPILPSAVRFARSGELSIGWRELGSGPETAVFVLPIYSNVDGIAGGPLGAFLEHLGSVVRVLMMDVRGTGVSDTAPDAPDTAAYAADVLTVLDAAGVDRAHVVTVGPACAIALHLAAGWPERIASLVLLTPWPSDAAGSAWPSYAILTESAEHWGSGHSLMAFQPELAQRPGGRERAARIERAGASPQDARRAVAWAGTIDYADDARCAAVQTAIVVQRDSPELAAPGVALAEAVAGARLIDVPGSSVLPWDDGAVELAGVIEECLLGTRTTGGLSRTLRTLLVTDIVGSTDLAARLGDERWRSLRDRHDTTVRELLRAFAGREVKHTGDGFLAVLPSPSDAVRCAKAIQQGLAPDDVHVRAGVHVGECEVLGDDLGGLAVHVAARTAALAAGDEVLVTLAVRDAMLGSGVVFSAAGEHDLKGVPGSWALFAAG